MELEVKEFPVVTDTFHLSTWITLNITCYVFPKLILAQHLEAGRCKSLNAVSILGYLVKLYGEAWNYDMQIHLMLTSRRRNCSRKLSDAEALSEAIKEKRRSIRSSFDTCWRLAFRSLRIMKIQQTCHEKSQQTYAVRCGINFTLISHISLKSFSLATFWRQIASKSGISCTREVQWSSFDLPRQRQLQN